MKKFKNYFRNLIQKLLGDYGLKLSRIISDETYHTAMSLMLCKHGYALKSHSRIEESFIKHCVNSFPNSFSQRGQDLFALWSNPHLTNDRQLGGYCIEFGAADGVYLSNTYLLSMKYGCKSLLIEPNPKFYSKLKKNRAQDTVIKGAVREIGMESGSTIEFLDEGLLTMRKGLPVAESLKNVFNVNASSFKVNVVDLNHEIVSAFGSNVTNINYISMDTEGSELEILKTINFDKYKFNCMTIECDETQIKRSEEIIALLKDKGYNRVFDYGITGVDLYFLPINHIHLILNQD